jgi:hypothetical protein
MEQVEIHIKGQIDKNWSDWLEGLSISYQQTETVLTGLVQDQSALYGILIKICDLGLPLISLKCLKSEHGIKEVKEM